MRFGLIPALGRGGATASVLASSTSSLARTRSAPDRGSHRNWHRTVRRLVISCHWRAALIAPSFGANRPRGIAVQASSRKLWHTRLRRAVLGSTVAVSTVSATHCLTTHSSRRCFATRLNSSVRLWCSNSIGARIFDQFTGAHAVGSGQGFLP
jgi:hypothetical protein